MKITPDDKMIDRMLDIVAWNTNPTKIESLKSKLGLDKIESEFFSGNIRKMIILGLIYKIPNDENFVAVHKFGYECLAHGGWIKYHESIERRDKLEIIRLEQANTTHWLTISLSVLAVLISVLSLTCNKINNSHQSNYHCHYCYKNF